MSVASRRRNSGECSRELVRDAPRSRPLASAAVVHSETRAVAFGSSCAVPHPLLADAADFGAAGLACLLWSSLALPPRWSRASLTRPSASSSRAVRRIRVRALWVLGSFVRLEWRVLVHWGPAFAWSRHSHSGPSWAPPSRPVHLGADIRLLGVGSTGRPPAGWEGRCPAHSTLWPMLDTMVVGGLSRRR